MNNKVANKGKHVDYEKSADTKQEPPSRFTDRQRQEKQARKGAVGGF